MKLGLISPKGVCMGSDDNQRRTKQIYSKLVGMETLEELMSCPNSPLLTIAAIVQDYFTEIKFIDEEVETIDFNESYDLVAMSFMTQQASRAFELAKKYKEMGVYTCAGGMHPTNSPDETIKYFDTVFIGEGEVTWIEFMEDIKRQSPKKIYQNVDEIDMEKVPVPRFDLLKLDAYKTIPIQISRGCPHNCEFCASTKVYGPKYRHKSVERILEEVDLVTSLKPNIQIYFTDDNMLVNERFSKKLLTELCKRKIRWMSHTDIGVAEHEEILKLLHKSGCSKLVIGFESIEPNSLKHLERWKYKKYKHYEEYIAKIQSYGVGVWGTFIVGLDSDERSIFQKVVDFALDNNLYGAMISVPTPFPGSKLYERLEEEDRILTKYWGDYTLWNVVVRPKKMSVKELENGFEYVLTSVYSIENRMKRLNHFKRIYTNLMRNQNV